MTLKGGLDQPSDIAIHKQGDAYVLDGLNGRVVVFDKGGKLLFSFGQTGSGKGELNLPMAIDLEGDTLYVADTGNSRIAVFDRRGNFIRNIDLEVEKGEAEPVGIVVNDGNITWSDRKNHRVCRIKGGKNDCRGGWGEDEGLFRYPFMMAADSDGYIHVVDVLNGRVQYFNSRGIYFGQLSRFGLLPGELFRPNGIDFDSEGRLFVTDSYLGKVSIFDSERYMGSLSDKKGET
ncbi:MAG: NHL repeat-containing protein, partial [Proteobacteria bacterium]|nr:NHL repeat-containing protein [Pseudomonadota bacterium]